MIDDPAYITQSNWSEIGKLLIFVWLLVLAAIGFGGSMLLAHGILPSLAANRDLPNEQLLKLPIVGRTLTLHPREQLLKLQPLLYGTAILFLGGAGVLVRLLVSKADVIEDFYGRWWI